MLGGCGREALELRAREGGIGVGGREVRHEADDALGPFGELRKAVASHSGLELQMDADAVGNLVVRDGELEVRVTCMRDLATRRERAHDEDADAGVFRAQGEPFLHGRHAKGARSGPQRRARDVDGSVAVAVRLDDGPELRAVELAQERAHVAPQRAEVDGDLRPVHAQRL